MPGSKFLSYGLSFVSLAIYWVNHHHLFQAARTVNGRVLWANMLLLFFLQTLIMSLRGGCAVAESE